MSILSTATLVESTVFLCVHSIKGVYTTADYLLAGSRSNVRQQVEQLDIHKRLQSISSFLEDHEPHLHTKSIQIAIDDVRDIVVQIEREMNLLRDELDAFEQRWFTYWRTPDSDKYMERLRHLSHLLDKRIQFLFQLCTTERIMKNV